MKNVSKDTRTFILVAAVVGLGMAGDAMLYCVLPVTPETFRVNVFQVGILLSVNRFVRLITNEVSTYFVARACSYKPLVYAVIVAALITFGYAVPLGFWWLLFLRIIWGGCFSVLRIEGYIAALKCSKGESIGKIIGWYEIIKAIAYYTITVISGILADVLNPLVTAVILGIVVASTLLLIRKPVQMWGTVSVGMPEISRKRDKIKVSNPLVLMAIGVVVLVVVSSSQMLSSLRGRAIVDTILPGSGFGIGAATFAGLFSVLYQMGVFFGPVMGTIGDRYGKRKALIGVGLSMTVVMAVLAVCHVWFIVLGIFILQIFINVSSEVLRSSFAAENACPGEQTVFLNRYSTFQDLGSALGPFLGFAIYSLTGNFVGLAVIMIPLLLISVYILYIFDRIGVKNGKNIEKLC